MVDVRMPPTFTDEGLRAALVVRQRWPGRRACWSCRQYVEERCAAELLSDRRRTASATCSRTGWRTSAEFLDALDRVGAMGRTAP